MAVNKGLLFGAALANGVNAFLDAREKGDLQRQRQALATVEQQMKQQQLANLQQVGQFQAQKMKDWPIQQQADRDIRKTQAEAALARATNTGSLSESEKTRMAILAGAGLLPEEGESNADYGKSLIDYLKLPDADPFIKSVINEHLSIPIARAGKEDLEDNLFWDVFDKVFPNRNLDQIYEAASTPNHPHRALALQGLGIGTDSQKMQFVPGSAESEAEKRAGEIHEKKMDAIEQEVEDKKKLTPQQIITIQKHLESKPELKNLIKGPLKTVDQAVTVLGSTEVFEAFVNQPQTELIKTSDGRVMLWNPTQPNAAPRELVGVSPGLEQLTPSEILALTDRPLKMRERFEARTTTRTYKTVLRAYERIIDVAKAYVRKEVTPGVFDIALSNQYRKMLDPPSVVRNSENEAVKKALGLLDQLEANVKSVEGGDDFSPEARVSIMNAMQALMSASHRDYANSYEEEKKSVKAQIAVVNTFEDRVRPEDWEAYQFDVETVLGSSPISKTGEHSYSPVPDVSKVTGPSGSQTGNDGKRRFTGNVLAPKFQPAK